MERSTIIFATILLSIVVATWLLLLQPLPPQSLQSGTWMADSMPLSPQRYRDNLDLVTPDDEALPTESYVMHAWTAWINQDLDRAEMLYKISYMQNPDNIQALRDIGHICYENERYFLSCNYYEQYLIYSPDQISSYIYLARALRRANRLREAQQTSLSGLETSEGQMHPGRLYYVLSLIYRDMHRPELQAEYQVKAFDALAAEGADIFKVLDEIRGDEPEAIRGGVAPPGNIN
jgi:tetratricopeptide (TPR) repeat protein